MKLIKVNESLINNPNLATYVERTDFRDKDEIQELAKEHNVKIVDFGEDNKSLKAEGKFDDIITFYKELNLIPNSSEEENEEVKTETEEEETLSESSDNEPLTESYLDNLKNSEYWQHQVDYQIEKFGRVGGGLIQDLDEAGFYLDKDNKVTSKAEIKENCLTEDTIKQGNKWVNKGKDGTHGEFKTKKAAEAQRKAMFANGFSESLTEDVDSSEEKKDEESLDPPEAGDPIGVANLLNMLIKSEWDAIEDYNSAIQTLTGMNFDETILNIIKDIVGEEHVHIGQLQKALETVSPNAVNIQEGEKEATEQLQEPVYTKEEGQEVTPEGIVKSDTEENQK
jgi:hypothetical protein